MRILQLNLIAFGPFTDCQLDLSAGQEGLHVIYGPNEAGKSSALRAISDLFFGIHVRTSDNFVHPYPKLRIGARIQHGDGSVLDCIRRKGNQNTLRGDDDTTPLDDEQLIHYLGNVDRDLFHTMFGIDHERLRRGGAEIVQGGGRLGELLFAAGAGLADLHDVQQRLQTDIEKLFKSTGRSGSIVSGVKDYQDALLAVKSSQVSVDTWRHHDENLQLAESQKHTLDATIRKLRSDQNRLLRIRNSLPAIARWKKASEEIAAFSEAPILPDEFEDTSHAAIVELRKSEQQQRDAENDLTGLKQQLESTLVPTHILAESDAIEALRDRLGGYRKAMSDLPNLETSREIAEGEATEILRVLNRAPNLEKIEQLRLPADKTVRIQDLGNQKEALSERLQSARRDCEKLRRTIQRSEEKLQVIHIPAAVGELRETTRQIQLESDLETQLLTNTATLESLIQEASLKIQQLTLWDGSIDLAEALPVPTPATLDRFDLEFNKVRADIQSLRDRAEEENSAIQELDEQLGNLELEQSVPTVDELTQLRSTRDQGWQLVLRAWRKHLESSQDVDEFVKRFSPLQNLADAFARSVQDADQVADRLRNDADRVAKKATWQAERDQRSRRGISLSRELQEAENRKNDLDSQWNALWNPIEVTPSTPAEMREWLRQHHDIAQLAASIRSTRHEIRRMQERLGCIRSDLCSTLTAAGETVNDNHSLHSLLSQATQHIEDVQSAVQQRDQLLNSISNSREELEEAESRFAQAEHELTQWQSDWSLEMSRLGLEGDALPSQANRVLTDINELFKKYQQADQYRTRLEGISRESQDFQTDVRALAERLVPDSVELPTADIVNLLVSNLQEARSAKQEHDSLIQQVASLENKSRCANEAISNVKAQLNEMCRQAACQAYEQLSDAARRSNQRVALETTVRDLEDQLIKQGSGSKLDDLIAEAEAESDQVDSIAPRIEELDREIEQTNAERDEVVRQIEREKAELRRVDGSGDAAEKAVACEGIAANLEEQIEQLAVLRMAAAMLHAAIERHRDKNQGPVLSRASALFSQITRNRFQRLQAEFNERGNPILTGVRSEGQEVVDVAGMSDGTCDQLYLALRLASLETWLQHHEPLPFIVDDVLLNFDDQRAIATLKALGDLSTKTQVIFFTHHRHLVDIAQQHLAKDQLFVHELAAG